MLVESEVCVHVYVWVVKKVANNDMKEQIFITER